MRTNSASQSGTFDPRALLAFALSSVGVLLAMFSFAAPPPGRITEWEAVSPGNPPVSRLTTNANQETAGSGWSIVASSNTSATQTNVLSAVTCVSASDCWAVGYYSGTGSFYQTLIERWNGDSWAIVTSPNALPLQNNILTGVTCASASDCWAVGYYPLGNAYQTLIERWDGTSWSIVTSPNTTPTESNLLNGVTCVSASDCWTVGFYSPVSGTGLQTLIERWNGTAWSIVTSPNTSPTRTNFLNSVTCASALNCWTVGGRVDTIYQTLIERWDGTSWAIVTSPNASPTRSSVLYAVACVPASDCWAVGYQNNGIANQPLAQRWDGTSWAIVTAPYTNPNEPNSFFGLTCVSASDCWAVGYYGTPSSTRQTLIERWNGTTWAIVPSPNTGPTLYNTLAGVTCVSSSDCWAVGSHIGSVYQTLIERYTASPAPIPTSVVSRKTHSTASDFDIDLPLAGTPGIECRSGGATNDYKLVFTFPNNTTVTSASVSSGTGSVSSSALGPNQNQYTVNLTGITNAQYLTVTLNGVLDSTGGSGNVVGPQMGVLVGDTTGDGSVNSADIAQTKSQSGTAVTNSNFREDVTVDGNLNSADIALVKSKSGTALP